MKLSVAHITRTEDRRGLYQAVEAGSSRLRLLAELSRDLRRPRDERGVWEIALHHAGRFCAMEQGWVLDPQGRVLLGPDQPLPERFLWAARPPVPGTPRSSVHAQAAHEGGAPGTEGASGLPVVPGGPQSEFRRLRGGAALRVPVGAGRQWLGTLVLGSAHDVRAPDPEDLTTLDILGAQVGAAAQLLRLSAELTRSSRQARQLRLGGPRAPTGSRDPHPDLGAAFLTPREREVLTLVARGLSNPEIGAALGIRAGTAKIHVERILSKLGVADRTGAAMLGLSLGLIEP